MSGDHFPTVFSLGADRRVGTLDLQLVAAATVLAAVVLVVPVDEPTLLRAAVGLPLVLVLPGYAVAAALFPASADRTPVGVAAVWHEDARAVSGVERAVVSVVASVAVVGAAGIVANAVVGVTLLPILALVVAVTLGATLAAYTQRLRLPEGRRHAPLSSLAGPTGLALPGTATGWFVLAAGVLALVVVGASGVAALGADGDGVTEFYVGGQADDGTVAMGAQPTNLTVGETVTHYLVVGQHNADATDYTVVATLDPAGAANGSELARHRISLESTGSAVQPTEVTAGTAGNATVEYYLYEGSAPAAVGEESALRHLQVQLTVRES